MKLGFYFTAGLKYRSFLSRRICAANSLISVRSRCISLQPYHNA